MIYRATLVIDVNINDEVIEDSHPQLEKLVVAQVRKSLTRQKKFIKPSNVLEIFRPVKEHPNDPPRTDSKS